MVFNGIERESVPLWAGHKGDTFVETLTGLPIDLHCADEHRGGLHTLAWETRGRRWCERQSMRKIMPVSEDRNMKVGQGRCCLSRKHKIVAKERASKTTGKSSIAASEIREVPKHSYILSFH